MRRLDRKR